MKCRKCGAEVSAEDKRCAACGAPVLLRVMEKEEKEKKLNNKQETADVKKDNTAEFEEQKTTRIDTESFRAAAEKAERERINKNEKDDKEENKSHIVRNTILGVIAAAAVFAVVSYASFHMSSSDDELAINSPSPTALDVNMLEMTPQPTIEPTAEPTPETTPFITPEPAVEETAKDAAEVTEATPEPTVKATKKPTEKPRKITRNNYLFPSDSAYITMADVNGLSKYDVALIRNEIYARKGYVFKTAEYRNYFNSQAWYKPNPKANTNIVLNAYEKANVDFRKAYEQSKGWR